MAFMKLKIDKEKLNDYSGDGGNYINTSGMYEVILKSVIVDVSAKGSQSINLWLEHNGQDQIIFNAMRLTNNDGTANLGAELFDKLCVVLGMEDEFEIPDPISRMLPIGKGGTEKECSVLEVFDNLPVHFRLQMEYGMYEGKVQERKNIRNFFRYEDKATAKEITDNIEEVGKQYEKEMEIADKITYKDGLTEEDVAEWKKNLRSGSKTKGETKKPSTGFGSKRFGQKKD